MAWRCWGARGSLGGLEPFGAIWNNLEAFETIWSIWVDFDSNLARLLLEFGWVLGVFPYVKPSKNLREPPQEAPGTLRDPIGTPQEPPGTPWVTGYGVQMAPNGTLLGHCYSHARNLGGW